MNRREALALMGGLSMTAFLPTLARADTKNIKLGYNVATLANPFFQGMTKGVVDAAAKYPNITLINTNANGDANTQSTMVVDLINQGVDALILNPINANSIVPVVEQANKKNIPVFTLDRGAAGGDTVNFLETDNVALGREGAQFILDKLKARYGKIQGNVVDLVGLIGTTAGDDRDKGFTEVFNKAAGENPDLKLVARQEGKFDQETSFNLMSQIMAANPQIDAVFKKAVELGKASASEADAGMARLSTSGEIAKVLGGADLVIDHTAEDFVEAVLGATDDVGAHVVCDLAGGDFVGRSWQCTAREGRYLPVGFTDDDQNGMTGRPLRMASIGNFSIVGILGAWVDQVDPGMRRFGFNPFTREQGDRVHAALTVLVESGAVRPHVGRVVDIDEAAAALADHQARRSVGRTVVIDGRHELALRRERKSGRSGKLLSNADALDPGPACDREHRALGRVAEERGLPLGCHEGCVVAGQAPDEAPMKRLMVSVTDGRAVELLQASAAAVTRAGH